MPKSIAMELQARKWAMEPMALKSFIERVAGLPAVANVAATNKQTKQLQVVDSRAVIPISGVLLKTVPAWVRAWGIEATGYDEVRLQIRQAVSNESVKSIHLQVDSPGGEVAGLIEAADAIFSSRKQKPVTATIEDVVASGAYWLTSQAQTIKAGRNTMVGAIGVFSVFVDSSQRAKDRGLKVHVIRSGEHKGMGIDAITDNQIKAVQEIVDGQVDNFIDAVARGRGIPKKHVKDWATGQLWMAGKALQLGLIDEISVKQAVSKTATQDIGGKPVPTEGTEQKKSTKTKEQIIEQVKAEERKRLTELKEAFADDLEFVAEAFELGLSIEEAKAYYCEILLLEQAENKSSEPHLGAKAVPTEGTDNGDSGDFMEAARELVDQGKVKSMTEAMKKVRRQDPGLHERFLEESRDQGSSLN